ncbi:MAG: adenosylmethionine--8-amino-7-oxononanoate transaminase [Candidatus Margulisiibacteriota bacterium]
MKIIKNQQISDDLAVNWHPFMQMKDFETYPPKYITHAEGLKLYSEDTWYYDTISSWWCNILGHRHPAITKALNDQLNTLDHIMFGNFTHQPAIDLSKRLVNITPNALERVYYSDNGSTAIEVALKMSLHYWLNKNEPQKKGLIFFNGSYHGDTIGAMSVSGVSQYNQVFRPLMFDAKGMPDPSLNEGNALQLLEDTLRKDSDSVAAVIIEPLLMGAGGMKLTSIQFFRQVRKLTQEYNVHLISDEVATGFGRTGHLFASDAANVTPDFMCLSKALTNGQFPLAVTMTTNEIYNAFYANFEEGKTFYHGHTFTANPLGCAVANATLQELTTWDWQSHVKNLSDFLSSKVKTFEEKYRFVSNARSIGTVAAIDLDLPGDRALFLLSQEGFNHHLTIRPLGNSIYLYLPLITSKKECHEILELLDQLLTKVASK